MFDGVVTTPELLRIPPPHLKHWIVRVAPYLKKMADGSGGRFLAEDIVIAIAQEHMHLWIVLIGPEIAAVGVTEFQKYPRAKALRFCGIVGLGWRRWVHLREGIEEWGRQNGCTLSEALLAHSKWMRMMPGYRADHTRVVKAL
jgi:hypothetical protein